MNYLLAIIAVILISLLSFAGVVTLGVRKKVLDKLLLIMVAFSVGALLGDTIFHLLPEAVEVAEGFTSTISILMLLGILAFFLLEKSLRWRHCHDVDCEDHPSHLGTLNLVGDGVHNLVDGILIGASFMVSIPLGIATTIAVAAHEIPQELGNYAVLLHSGFERRKALLYNFYSALTAVVGTVAVLIIGSRVQSIADFFVPFTAGTFIYIAMSDLIPELHRTESQRESFWHFVAIVAGLAVMALLLILG